jgi:hypothetical protein
LKGLSVTEVNVLGKLCAALMDAGIAALLAVKPDEKETLDELFEVVVPDSEQFNLQHSLAIETTGVACRERAFLQHAGKFGIEHEASLSCAPTPIAALSTEIRRQAVSNFCIESRISSSE